MESELDGLVETLLDPVQGGQDVEANKSRVSRPEQAGRVWRRQEHRRNAALQPLVCELAVRLLSPADDRDELDRRSEIAGKSWSFSG